MRQPKNSIIWSFGLSNEQAALVAGLAGKNYQLHNWAHDAFPSLKDLETDKPGLALFNIASLANLPKLLSGSGQHLALLPKIAFMDENYSQADLEFAIDCKVEEIIRPPYSRKQFMEKIQQATAMEAIHHDMMCMSREIMLEREILERKNDILNFLVNFVTNTSNCLNQESIISTAFDSFNMLFPVRTIHATLWDPTANTPEAHFYLSTPSYSDAHPKWYSLLRKQTIESMNKQPNIFVTHLTLPGQHNKWFNAAPTDGYPLYLPIRMGDEQLGVITLLIDAEINLSRDQALALNSVLQHLALTLKNAYSFQKIKLLADYDALTGVHSRRHFEQRLLEEVSRAKRNHQNLALIFADLDHFKKVNDTMGHRVGDQVLQQAAGIIRNSLRTYDYSARYGGEEFVIIMPHTTCRNATIFAERLREKISKHVFTTDAGDINITISMGVSGISDKSKKTGNMLLQEADKALYQAKNSGRNCVMDYTTRKSVEAI